MNTATEFWAKVNKDGPVHLRLGTRCWLWTGATSPRGYGKIRYQNRHLRTHRLSYELVHGMPTGVVMHKCDVPGCVNPEHLEIGTYAKNNRDRMLRGRSSTGEKHGAILRPVMRRGVDNPQSKLTETQVQELRKLRKSGWLLRELSQRYQISESTVSKIDRREMWAHIP